MSHQLSRKDKLAMEDSSNTASDPPRDSMHKVKSLLDGAADRMREVLDDAPPSLDPDATGDPALTKRLNDVIEMMVKRAADLASDAEGTAAKIDPEAGTFDGIPVERKSDQTSKE